MVSNSIARSLHVLDVRKGRPPGSVMHSLILVLLIMSASAFGSEAAHADLYVSSNGSDSNSGTASAPFRTISRASQAALAGTIIHVAPGTYPGGFSTSKSGTASARIRYVSDVRGGAVIADGNTGADMGWDNGGSYVDIEGFDMNGSGTRWRLGLYSSGTGTVIKNNRVHDIMTNFTAGGMGGAAIEIDNYNSPNTYGEIIGNVVYNIGPTYNDNNIHGIYMTAQGKVLNNLVYRVTAWCIHTWHDAHHITIANNTVFNCLSGGMAIGAGDFVHTNAPADYMVVANNIVFDNPSYGIVEAGSTGSHNVFANNLVYNSGQNWRLLTSSHAGTIAADPQFVNYIRSGGGDYHLKSTSPAIDRGTGAYSPPTNDLDGGARPKGEGYDIGAYEAGSTTSTPTPTPQPVPPSTGSAETVLANRIPSISAASDTKAVELGVKFRSKVGGHITGIRFYRGVGSSSGFTVYLYDSSGKRLASGSTSGQIAVPGYVQVNFATPVSIAANTTYVASYYAPNGQYAYQEQGLANAISSTNLSLLAGGANGGNGVFSYGTNGVMPKSSFENSNYFVDVMFVPSAATSPASVGTTIRVSAAGASTSTTSPLMIIFVNGTRLGQTYITSSTAKDFTFNTTLAQNQIKDVTVQLANDNYGVDLFVRSVALGSTQPLLSSSSEVVYDRGALDGRDIVRNSNGNMYWNGYLIFKFP